MRATALLTSFFFVLACLIPAAAFANKPPRKRNGPTTGTVEVFCFVKGAEVELNGQSVGQAPLTKAITLKPGTYTVRVHKRGYTEFIETVSVEAGKNVELEADLIAFAGIVKINANVAGASVAVDGKLAGKVPFDKDIQAGKHTITVQAEGHEPFSQELDIQAGKRHAVDVELKALPDKPPVVAEGGVHTKWWFWTIIGVVVAGGATAAGVALANQPESTPAGFQEHIQLP